MCCHCDDRSPLLNYMNMSCLFVSGPISLRSFSAAASAFPASIAFDASAYAALSHLLLLLALLLLHLYLHPHIISFLLLVLLLILILSKKKKEKHQDPAAKGTFELVTIAPKLTSVFRGKRCAVNPNAPAACFKPSQAQAIFNRPGLYARTSNKREKAENNAKANNSTLPPQKKKH